MFELNKISANSLFILINAILHHETEYKKENSVNDR